MILLFKTYYTERRDVAHLFIFEFTPTIRTLSCFGIVRRTRERNLNINPRLENVLLRISSQMTPEEIEKRSRVQQRGRFSTQAQDKEIVDNIKNETCGVEPLSKTDKDSNSQITIFDFI